MAWAIRIGLLALAGAQGFGGAIIANGVAQVFDPQTGQFVVAATETAARYGAAGSLKLAHALPMRVIQLLAILAWVLSFTQLNANRQLRLVLLAAAGCAGLIAVSAAQTFSGAAPFALRPLLAAATVAAGLAVLLP